MIMTLSSAAMRRREAVVSLARAGGMAAASAGLGYWLSRRSHRPSERVAAVFSARDHRVPDEARFPKMVVVRGGDPRRILRRAIEELGGIGRFIAPGEVVVIKPNASWDRTPEQAANTNPLVVAEMVKLCRQAGAKRIIVTDVTINEARRCFQRSGIGEAASSEGAEVILPEARFLRRVDLGGTALGAWPVLEPFLLCDKIINLPVAKHHSLTGVTLGLKNWYGILGGNRMRLHQRIHESLADLAAFMLPTLTVIDGYRVLLRNGPGGGNLSDTALEQTVAAGTDPVALDAWAAKTWWRMEAKQLPYLNLAAQRGLGTPDFEKLNSKTIDL